MTAVHATMTKFGYPATLIREYGCWTVQLRPKQATLGAMVLICKEEAAAFSALSVAAFAELSQVIRDLEKAATEVFAYERINYLMLMMVDPHVHFHVLPRYSGEKVFGATSFADPAWPGPPDLAFANDINGEVMAGLRAALQARWPA